MAISLQTDLVPGNGKLPFGVAAGAALGIALAYVASRAAALLDNAFAAIPLTIVVAYGSYAAASALGASGIFAVAAAGIALRSQTRASIGAAASERIDRFWDRSALLANAVVFLLVGLTLRLERIFNEPTLIALTLLGVVAARALLAYVLARPPVRGPAASGWKHAIALAGLRGGLSLAMALQLPAGFPSRPALIDPEGHRGLVQLRARLPENGAASGCAHLLPGSGANRAGQSQDVVQSQLGLVSRAATTPSRKSPPADRWN